MSGTTTYLVVLVIFCAAITHAVAPCKNSIIKKLAGIKECYYCGQTPKLIAETTFATYVMVSKADIPSIVSCAVATWKHLPRFYVSAHLDNGSSVLHTYYQEKRCKYILETDAEGNYYEIHVIHNLHGVYSYYRCISGNQTIEGNGADFVAILVGCDCVNNKETWAMVERAKICFKKLNITDTVTVTPCNC